jgi:hypothetical protein
MKVAQEHRQISHCRGKRPVSVTIQAVKCLTRVRVDEAEAATSKLRCRYGMRHPGENHSACDQRKHEAAVHCFWEDGRSGLRVILTKYGSLNFPRSAALLGKGKVAPSCNSGALPMSYTPDFKSEKRNPDHLTRKMIRSLGQTTDTINFYTVLHRSNSIDDAGTMV